MYHLNVLSVHFDSYDIEGILIVLMFFSLSCTYNARICHSEILQQSIDVVDKKNDV